MDEADIARSGDAWLRGHRVAAAAVVEIGQPTDGEPVLVQYGEAEVLDPDAEFEALSITKTMVAAVALQLVDEGKLTLDGGLPSIEGVATNVTDTLTLRRLLSHSSGLQDYRENPDYRDDMILTPVEAVNLAVSGSDLTSTRTSYAAPNYLLAALAIETVTGQPLSEVLDQRLFTPLGMDHTRVVNNTRAGFVGHGSGGVVSTVADLAHWYDALMRTHDVLSDKTFQEMVWGGRMFQRNAGTRCVAALSLWTALG